MMGLKYLILFLVIFVLCEPSYCQAELTLPVEFQNLSISSKALSKKFEFTLDSNTTDTSQSFALDTTGLILHLVASPKIKDGNTKIRIFSSDGTEVQTYKFIDSTVFALVEPQKAYSIYEEIIPKCDDLIMAFTFDQASIICPDKEMFKLYENIMIDKDTSFKINLRKPEEFYSAALTLPENTKFAEKFTNISVNLGDTGSSILEFKRTPVNIADLLAVGKLCIVSKKKTSSKTELSNCSFVNINVNSVITFMTSFLDKDVSMIAPNLVFSFIPGRFNNLLHNYAFEFSEDIRSKDKPVEINSSSLDRYFLENNSSNFSINLGQIPAAAKKNRKNIFNLTNPIELNRTLNDASFSVPLNNLDAFLTLSLNNMSLDVFLNNLSLAGNENLLNVFNLSTNNNIIIKNLLDPPSPEKDKQRLQTIAPSSLIISSYLPDKLSNLKISRDYTFVEQVVAPSVDDKGKPIEIVNNKSKADLVLSKNFLNIDLSNQINPFGLTIEKTSTLLNNKSFTMQGSVTGFLLPPDFRPVLENGYRATVQFTMTINLINDELLKIIYSDLKTKDETPLTNFFGSSFLPLGKYDVNLEFDSDRTKLFQNAGVVKPEVKSDK